jgi:hypothetical protein
MSKDNQPSASSAAKPVAEIEKDGGKWYVVDGLAWPLSVANGQQAAKPAAAAGTSSESSAPTKTDPPAKPDAVAALKKLLQHPTLRKSLSSHSRIVGRKEAKSATGGVREGSKVYRMNCTSGLDLLTSSSGILSTFFGATVVTSTADFAQFSPIFDMVRMMGINVRYEPAGSGTAPPLASGVGVHLPSAWCFDPEAVGALSFVTLTNTRDWNEGKLNKFTNTSKPFVHRFEVPNRTMFVLNGNPQPIATLGDWCSTSSYGGVGGGLEHSVHTFTLNNVALLGTVVLTFEMEFTYRL